MRDWHANYREGDTPWDRGAPSPLLVQWLNEAGRPDLAWELGEIPSAGQSALPSSEKSVVPAEMASESAVIDGLGLTLGNRVLVPGCGRGHEVVELAGRGWSVTGLDLVPEALQECQRRLDALGFTAQLLEADVLQWQPAQPVDLVYEQTCLCAIDPQYWSAYEKQLRSWLKPTGTLLIAFMQTGQSGGPPFDCPLDKMRQLFGAWEWSESIMRIDRPGAPNHEMGFQLRPQRECDSATI